MLLYVIPERGKQGGLAHSLEIGTVEKYRKAFNVVFCCYILYDNNIPIRLHTCYVSFNFEKDNEVFELKLSYNFRSIRRQKWGIHLRKDRVNTKGPSMVVKHTRLSDILNNWSPRFNFKKSSHWVNFHESEGVRVKWRRKKQNVLQSLTPFQGATNTLEQSISLPLASAEIVNSSIFILPFPSKMQKLKLLKDATNYFGSIYMYNLTVRCKPILKAFKFEKMSAVELWAKMLMI